jgi:hypothetical protein
MPRISYFYGIAIYIYHQDHGPPHFHAIYGEHEAIVAVETGELVQGGLPPRAKSLVAEWARIHREALERNWQLAQAGEPLEQIAPLD